MMENQNPKKPLNKWLVLMNIPFQMGVIIFIGVFFGKWLDENVFQNDSSIGIIVFSLLAVFLALYNVIRQVNQLNK